MWKSDGTEAGTVLVADIRPGRADSDPRELAFVNGALFFSADDGRNGREPWILRRDAPTAGVSESDRLRRPLTSAGTLAGDVFFGALGPDADWLDELNLANFLGPRPGQPGEDGPVADWVTRPRRPR